MKKVLVLLFTCVSLLSAQSRQDNVAEKLIGAWRLVSVEGTDATFHFAYDHPTGVIIYDRSGWMSVQIDAKGIRKPFVGGAGGGTSEEKVAAFDNYIAYYGRYTLDLKAPNRHSPPGRLKRTELARCQQCQMVRVSRQ